MRGPVEKSRGLAAAADAHGSTMTHTRTQAVRAPSSCPLALRQYCCAVFKRCRFAMKFVTIDITAPSALVAEIRKLSLCVDGRTLVFAPIDMYCNSTISTTDKKIAEEQKRAG